MKSSCTSLIAGLVVLLGACSAAPYDTPVGDELAFRNKYGYTRLAQRFAERGHNDNVCQTNEVYKVFKTPPRSVDASSFCSKYILPTSTLTSTSTDVVVVTEHTTVTKTEATTTVVTATIATITELCATPTAPVTCGLEAFGFGQFLISSEVGISGLECHRRCLLDPACEAFQSQSGGLNVCNLFTVPTAGNVQPAPGSGFFFYDRDCTDLLPAGCALEQPQKFKRAPPLLPWIPAKPASQISAACTCLITSAPPATTTTVVVPVTTVTTTTDVVLTTETSFQTDTTEVTYVTYTTVV